MTPFIIPTKGSVWPKSLVSVINMAMFGMVVLYYTAYLGFLAQGRVGGGRFRLSEA